MVAVLIAILGAWYLGSLKGELAERHRNSTRQYSESAKSYASRTCANLPAPALFDCVENAAQRSAESAHAEQDLIAQQDSAFAATVMLAVSAGGTFVGFLGLWFILQTLAETRKAARASIRGAIASRAANRIAQNTANQQLRAYVDLSKARVIEVDGVWYFRLWVKNFGQTPAVNVCCWIDSYLMTWPIKNKPSAVTLLLGGGTLPPGHDRRYSQPLNGAEAMLADKAFFVVAVRVTYEFLDGGGQDELATWIVITDREAASKRPRYLGHHDMAE